MPPPWKPALAVEVASHYPALFPNRESTQRAVALLRELRSKSIEATERCEREGHPVVGDSRRCYCGTKTRFVTYQRKRRR